jgi:hypothetical protein
MSAWRIDKIDAQTRALAEAAAKAAGLPLGAWLERAIMRRVENRTPSQPIVFESTPVAAEPAPEAEAISPEMQAALQAAERRRHRSESTEQHEPADPFAAPESEDEEKPFERPPAPAAATDMILKLDEDAPIALPEEPQPNEPQRVEPIFDDPPFLDDDPPAADAPEAQSVTEPLPPLVTPNARDEETGLGITSRKPVIEPLRKSPERGLSSLGLLMAAGFAAILLAAGGGYYLFAGSPSAPQREETPAPPAPRPAEQSAAVPTPPPPVAPAPAPPAAAPPAPEPPAATPAPSPSPPSVPPSDPAAGAPSAPAMAMPQGGFVPSMTRPDAPAPTPAPTAAAAPAPARPVGPNDTLPALRNRAEAGELEARLELARRYLEGAGVGRNETEAGKWLLLAADQGNPQAQFNVGVMYERGVGMPANLAKALEYYRKSAAQNTPMAIHNLALIHANDHPGMKADPVQARRMMTRSAELGLGESQYSLALMYLQALGGPSDRVMALSWMAVAARPNQPQVIEQARQLSAQLSEADRQRARQLAEGHVQRIQANLRQIQAQQTAAASGTTPAPVASAPAAPEKPRVVDRGAIMEMQKLLTALKIYNGTADGAAGPRTSAAIREFQAMAGMPVDGKPSIELLDNLREVSGLTSQ